MAPIKSMGPLDCRYDGFLAHAPAGTDWETLNPENLYNQSKDDGAGALVVLPAKLIFLWIQLDCSACTGVTWFKKVARNAAGDVTTGVFSVAAGDVWEQGVSGHVGPNGIGVEALSLKLAVGTDVVGVFGQFDEPVNP